MERQEERYEDFKMKQNSAASAPKPNVSSSSCSCCIFETFSYFSF